jgi:filamin
MKHYLAGSPFQFTVGPLRDGGAHRVHAGGPGLERGEQGQPCEFNVWTREAGAGSLAISVEGPSKAEIDFKDRKDGSCYVSYTVGEPGKFTSLSLSLSRSLSVCLSFLLTVSIIS